MSRILIVDDDEFYSEYLEMSFKSEGMKVDLIDNPERVPSAVARFRPDLMLLDISMPGKNGFEVLEELSKQGAMRPRRIVILTSHRRASDFNKAMVMGADDFVVKPIAGKPLLDRLKRHMPAQSNWL